MSETKFTPGPWEAQLHENNQFGIHASDGTLFAVLVPSRVRNFEANARLIAAAPELVSCLQQAIAEATAPMGDGGINLSTVDWARKVISKATGGNHERL